MAVPLKLLVASGRPARIVVGDSIEADSLERLNSTGDLVVGSLLGGADELILGSASSVVRSVSDLHIDGLLQLGDLAAPGAPGTALGRLYKLSGDDGLWWHPNGGIAVDLTIAGSGSPAGVNHDIQFNNAGAFGGESLLTWDDAADLFTVNGLTVNAGGEMDLNDKDLIDARTITFEAVGTDTSTSNVLNIDFSENQKRNHVMTENVTSVTFTLPKGPGNFMVRIEQASGLFSLPATVSSWPASAEFVGDVAPVAPTANNNAILLGVYYDGTTVYFQTSGVFNN